MNIEVNEKAAESLMLEALRVGKCPWCCCYITERYVFDKMNPIIFEINGIKRRIIAYPQETFEESQKRWYKEGVITKEHYDKAISLLTFS